VVTIVVAELLRQLATSWVRAGRRPLHHQAVIVKRSALREFMQADAAAVRFAAEEGAAAVQGWRVERLDSRAWQQLDISALGMRDSMAAQSRPWIILSEAHPARELAATRHTSRQGPAPSQPHQGYRPRRRVERINCDDRAAFMAAVARHSAHRPAGR